MNKRLLYGIILGAILGIACIVGALTRYQSDVSVLYIISFWLNRVLIGLVIGLLVPSKDLKYLLPRGLFVGLFVSFSFYSATEFFDIVGFFAGAVYGVIIEYVLYKFSL